MICACVGDAQFCLREVWGKKTIEKQPVEQFQKQVEQFKKDILMVLLNIMFPGFILVLAYIFTLFLFMVK